MSYEPPPHYSIDPAVWKKWISGFWRYVLDNIGTGNTFTHGTGATSTGSDTSLTLTGIASGANVVIVMFDDVGTSAGGTNGVPRLQPNNSSTNEVSLFSIDGTTPVTGNAGTHIPLSSSGTAPNDWATDHVLSGSVTFQRMTGNEWIVQGASRNTTDADMHFQVGIVKLSAELASFTVTTNGGTAAFDNGSQFELMYQ